MWAVFVTLAVFYGRFEHRLMGEKLVGKIIQPIPKEGAPVAFSFSFVRPGTPPTIHTPVGYLPIEDLTHSLLPGQTTSVAGRLMPDGHIQTDFIAYHPGRKAKTTVSLLMVLLALVLGVVHFAPRKGRELG